MKFWDHNKVRQNKVTVQPIQYQHSFSAKMSDGCICPHYSSLYSALPIEKIIETPTHQCHPVFTQHYAPGLYPTVWNAFSSNL